MPGDFDIGVRDETREIVLAEYEIGIDSESTFVEIDPEGIDFGVPTDLTGCNVVSIQVRSLINNSYIPLDRDGDW
jgi:hypothetical protein